MNALGISWQRTLPVMVALTLAAGVASAQVAYRVVNLRLLAGGPGSDDINASRPSVDGLNRHGDVVGDGSAVATLAARPYLYRHATATVTNLGDLAGDFDSADRPKTWVYSINDAGVIVGYGPSAADPNTDLPYVYYDDNGNGAADPGEMRALPPNPGATEGIIRCINNNGQAVITGNGVYRWTDADGDLEIDPGERLLVTANSNTAYGINDQGDVIWTEAAAVCRWTDRNADGVVDPCEVACIPENVGGGVDVRGYDINNSGAVCGTAKDVFDRTRGMIWTDQNQDDIVDAAEVTLIIPDNFLANTFAWGINDAGSVVGGIAFGTDRYAFIWDAVNGVRNLNDLIVHDHPTLGAYQARQAYAINNGGQIAAYGQFENSNNEYAVLLDPVNCDLVAPAGVDLGDFAVLAGAWMQTGCVPPGWCDQADIDGSGAVDTTDLQVFGGHWLENALP